MLRLKMTILSMVLLTLGGCSGGSLGGAGLVWGESSSSNIATSSAPAHLAGPVDRQFLALTNQYRAERGLPALQLDPRLTSASQDMAQIIAAAGTPKVRQHSSRSLRKRLKDKGMGDVPAAENLLMGERNTQDAFNVWVNSRGHRANLINTSVTHLGAARVDKGGRSFWAMIMAGPPFTPRPMKLQLRGQTNGDFIPPDDQQ